MQPFEFAGRTNVEERKILIFLNHSVNFLGRDTDHVPVEFVPHDVGGGEIHQNPCGTPVAAGVGVSGHGVVLDVADHIELDAVLGNEIYYPRARHGIARHPCRQLPDAGPVLVHRDPVLLIPDNAVAQDVQAARCGLDVAGIDTEAML